MIKGMGEKWGKRDRKKVRKRTLERRKRGNRGRKERGQDEMGAGGEKKFRVHKNREQIILGGLDTAIRCAANKNASYGSSAHARICYLLREKLLSH
jgi:hypothetical protein